MFVLADIAATTTSIGVLRILGAIPIAGPLIVAFIIGGGSEGGKGGSGGGNSSNQPNDGGDV